MKIKVAPSSNVLHLAMTATKIALEWTKAITFIVTVVCMLLGKSWKSKKIIHLYQTFLNMHCSMTFLYKIMFHFPLVLGLEQGLQNFCPTPMYIVITLTYYILTEKTIQKCIPNILMYIPNTQFQDRILGLEKIHAVLAIKLVTTLVNLIFLVPVLPSLRITLLTSYVNVWLQYQSSKSLKIELDRELQLVANFRQATKEDLSSHEEDVCAICLGQMKSARVTPCQHCFHTNCLRLCIKNLNDSCPICKRVFHFD